MRLVSIVLSSVVLVTVQYRTCEGQTFTDDFNRPDGFLIGNGWGSWTNARLGGGWAVAPGSNAGGGILRNDLPFSFGNSMTFDFDFNDGGNAGWVVQINTTNPKLGNFDNQPRLLAVMQHRGEAGVRFKVGANLADGWIYSANARPWTNTVHISGIVNPDLSVQITVDYFDGGPVAVYDWASPGIEATTIEQGNLFSIGNSRDMGQAFIDNLVVVDLTPGCGEGGIPGDKDNDGILDENDNCPCYYNPTQEYNKADLDQDCDVDGNDFLTFTNCFNGSLNPPACP